VTWSGVARRVGRRTNTSAANNASWLMAVGILAVVIPASDKVAANQVFFAAHGVSSLAWIVILVLGLVLGWLVLTALLALLHRLAGPRTSDIVTSMLMLLVTWFFVGNVLARTVLGGALVLAPVFGLVVAAAITLLARRFAMGNALAAFALIAAVVPLVIPLVTGSQDAPTSAFTFDEQSHRPNVLWVISDELQYPAVFTQDGQVRSEYPNLQSLAANSTTYARAYSGANYTDYAVPSMLSGISNVAAQGTDRMQKVRAGIGIVPGMSAAYSIVMESPIYSFDCNSSDCASVGAGADVGIAQRYVAFAKDTLAIAGRTALASPFSDFFPSLDGKWRDFWSGGDEFGDNAEGNSVRKVIDGIDQVRTSNPTAPVFALWHTIRTHAPWVVDRQGKQIYPSRVPIVEGAHMIGAEANQSYTTDELKRLERRLWADSAVDFDRQLGLLIDDLKASGTYDDTMIVVTADHGATMTDHSDRRVGDTLEQRWSEIAHVPLVVKAPGQTVPAIVTEPKSTGQIAATVLETAGATAPADAALSPDLSGAVPGGPVFTTVAGGVMTPWEYIGVRETDPWRPEDLTPPDPRYPYAIGIDQALLGGPVPDGWSQVTPARVQALPGESDQLALIVDRDPADCSSDVTAGLVTSDGSVVGSVLWEGPAGSMGGQTRGWAIVPKADVASYAYWCPKN
jgi:hypothetical protein